MSNGNCIEGCEICGGVGFLRYDVDVGDPNFGQVYSCPNKRLKYLSDAVNISFGEAKGLDWNSYHQTEAVKQMRAAYNIVLEQGYGWIYIWGEAGNGKTIMAKSATVYAAGVLNITSHYVRLSEMINNLRASFDEEQGQRAYLTRKNYYAKVKFLVVDEIGRDRQTEFSKQTLSDVMDARYILATAKAGITIWVSNFAPEDILEPYQVDRIRDGRFQVVNVKGVSVRPAMKYEDDNGDDYIPWWLDRD